MKEYKGFYVDDELHIFNENGHSITPFIGTDGYMHIRRRTKDGIIYMRVHTLFATLFVPNPENYKYVNHKDSNKVNNDPSNLEWCTNSYNVYHGWHSGNRTHKNKTGVTVYQQDRLIGKYSSIRELSAALKLDRHKVARILKGEINNCYTYRFIYAEGQETIESIK